MNTTPFNFKKFHKVEFNLEFNDETIAIGFLIHPIFEKGFLLKKIQNLRTGSSRKRGSDKKMVTWIIRG